MEPVIVIGIVTFIFSLAGTYIGEFFGHVFEDKIEMVGGLILIFIGCKILIEDTLLKTCATPVGPEKISGNQGL